jgi:hypothetical protein
MRRESVDKAMEKFSRADCCGRLASSTRGKVKFKQRKFEDEWCSKPVDFVLSRSRKKRKSEVSLRYTHAGREREKKKKNDVHG